MSAIAYLNFDGIAEQVIEFYSVALNAIEVKKRNSGISRKIQTIQCRKMS